MFHQTKKSSVLVFADSCFIRLIIRTLTGLRATKVMNVQYVIYNNPRDYPNKFVVRRFVVRPNMPLADTEPIGVVNTLEEARALVPVIYDFKSMPRLLQDEPQIAETWMQPEFWKKILEILQREEISQHM